MNSFTKTGIFLRNKINEEKEKIYKMDTMECCRHCGISKTPEMLTFIKDAKNLIKAKEDALNYSLSLWDSKMCDTDTEFYDNFLLSKDSVQEHSKTFLEHYSNMTLGLYFVFYKDEVSNPNPTGDMIKDMVLKNLSEDNFMIQTLHENIKLT